jgi:DNA-binding response OmpR family regulator
MKSVLIIEDDEDIVNLLEIPLKDLQCNIIRKNDGPSGLEMAIAEHFDLIILDVMLPGLDGMEICRQIRMHQVRTPILMVSARSEEFDKVFGLEIGADDYLTKPFSIREFIARVKVIFRRKNDTLLRESNSVFPVIRHGALEIDVEKRKVSLSGVRIDLSPKEYELLTLLASNPGKSYNRRLLLSLVWGYDFEGYEHTINSHINRLRAKIEKDISIPVYILTTWGVGYRFNEEV